jgi:tetratricopeptide (TPR) repeat protein
MAKNQINKEKEKDIIQTIKEKLPDEERPNENNPLFKKIFLGAFAIVVMFTFFLASQTGINADEDFQIKYSEKLVDWYATMGKDTAATNFTYRKAEMHIYGGFYEVIAGATNRVLGNKPDSIPYQDVRHFWVAIMGLLTILFTALAAREGGGWKAALIALGLMTFSPYFLGNAVMNPKDIPFCLGFATSTYFMIRYFRDMPAPRKSTIFGLIMGFVIAFGTRSGGILLFAYFGLFTFFHIIVNYNLGKFIANRGLLWSYVRTALFVIVCGYFGSLLFWPYGLISPFKNPFSALSKFQLLGQSIPVLFEGKSMSSDSLPSYYALKSFLITTPLLVLVSFGLGIIFSWRLFKKYNPTAVFMGLFTAIFPVWYIYYKDSNVYNHWRHVLFIFPGVILIATFSLSFLLDFFSKKNKYAGYGFAGLISLGLLFPAIHIFSNYKTPYIYFNETVGGVKGATGNYETDYWGISMRQGVDFLKNEGLLEPKNGKEILIATDMGGAAFTYINGKYGDNVKAFYVKYRDRYSKKWDYGLFTSLYVPGEQVKAGQFPMQSSTIHTVSHARTPILAVMKQDTSMLTFKANEAMGKNDAVTAIALLSEEIKNHPDNEIALDDLVSCYTATKNFPEALKIIDKRAAITPNSPEIMFSKGYTMIQAGDINGAQAIFKQVIAKDPKNAQAYYYQGLAYAQSGNFNAAISSVEKSLKIEPSKGAYMLLAQIYDATGNKAAADGIRRQIQ